MERIKQKWNEARKVYGNAHVFILTDGTGVTGRYVLCPVGSVTASHQALNGFMPTEGFPMNEYGGSVNDREYYRYKDAQKKTEEIRAEIKSYLEDAANAQSERDFYKREIERMKDEAKSRTNQINLFDTSDDEA